MNNTAELENFLATKLADAIELAARDVIIPHIAENTPRLMDRRPPKPIKLSGSRPKYKIHGRRAVEWPGGAWYSGVTGNLKRSIDAVREGNVTRVGVVAEWPVRSTDYAEYLEFGTRYIAPFHFVTDAVHTDSQQKKFLAKIQKFFNQLI